MRVCFVTSSYPRWPGDLAEAVLGRLAHHVARLPGMHVTVLAPGEAGVSAVERRPGLEIRRLTYFLPRAWQRLAYRAGIPWNLRHSALARLNVPGFLGAYAAALCRHGRRADVVHAHWGPMGAVAAATQPVYRRPLVLTVHGTDWRTGSGLIRRLTAWAVRRADAVTSPSEEFVEELRGLRRGQGPCVWVPNGVEFPVRGDVDRQPVNASSPPTGRRLISVGRLIPERRHDLLVRAVARLRDRYPDTTLTLVGDGPAAADLRRLAAELGVTEAVRMTGRVPHGDVFRHLEEADLYVSSTSVESFGAAVLEAAACALPVVTSRVGYAATMVADGVTGRVVPPENEDALVEAVGAMLAEPAGLPWAGRRQRDRVEQLGLTCEAVARRFVDLYRTVCAGRGPAAART